MSKQRNSSIRGAVGYHAGANHVSMLCRWLGVDRIFLTENAPEPGRALAEMPDLKKFTRNGFLKLDSDQRAHAQLATYSKCIKKLKPRFDWIAFFDLDEFLVVRDQCASVPL
jgi:hypothetical protein